MKRKTIIRPIPNSSNRKLYDCCNQRIGESPVVTGTQASQAGARQAKGSHGVLCRRV